MQIMKYKMVELGYVIAQHFHFVFQFIFYRLAHKCSIELMLMI